MTTDKLTNLLDSTMHVVSQAIREIDGGQRNGWCDVGNIGTVRHALVVCLETLRQADADLDAMTEREAFAIALAQGSLSSSPLDTHWEGCYRFAGCHRTMEGQRARFTRLQPPHDTIECSTNTEGLVCRLYT